MSWRAVARQDFTDARRSKILGLAIGLFVVIIGLILATTNNSGPRAAENALWNLHGIATFFMPIVILIVAYLSVAGERESGRIKYLLGLPNTRRDVVLGKFLSRSLISTLAVVLSMLVGTLIIAVRYSSLPVGDILTLTLLMTWFAFVYTGIAVGVSALSATRARAMAGVISIYVVFTVLWTAPNINPRDSIAFVVEDLLGLAAKPDFYEFVFHLSPSFAYSRLVNGILFDLTQDGAVAPSSEAPFFLQDWFMPVILLSWVGGMLAIGYVRFRDAELG